VLTQIEIVLSLVQLVGLSLPAVALLLQVAGKANDSLGTGFDPDRAPFLSIRWSFIPLFLSGLILLIYLFTYSLFGVVWIFHSALFLVSNYVFNSIYFTNWDRSMVYEWDRSQTFI
jgi:hypothetical protein